MSEYGAGEVRLLLPRGASYVLRHVHYYVPDMTVNLILVGQLRDCGCHISLREGSFQMHCGSLVIVARGAKSCLNYYMHVSEVRDRTVLITLQPCREQHARHVTFADEL